MAKNIFNSVQMSKVGTNRFDLSHDVKMSFRMGELVPSCIMDVLPGDKVTISTETMIRFAPLVSPVMHHVKVTTHFFYVPNRILWPNWERWITGDLEVTPPYIQTTSGAANGSVADYMGVPSTSVVSEPEFLNALPFAAYAKIWWEYYRDQNLQTEDIFPYDGRYDWTELQDGDNSLEVISNLVLLDRPWKRAWQHDYFTGALPFAQKGEAVSIPILNQEGTVPVQWVAGEQPLIRENTIPFNPAINEVVRTIGGGELASGASAPGTAAIFDPNGSLVIDGSDIDVEAATINNLRRAFKLQEWLEKNARGGTRYKENIMAHFGVMTDDYRLQRPEYLGGSSQNVVISEVLSTAESTGVPVGDLAGHGISVGGGKQFSYFCKEHGWIIGLVNVQPVTAYQQGLHRAFSRFDRLDYYWPTFQHIGEQEVLSKELYLDQDTQAERDATFGYVPRYAEYKYLNSRVAGEFKDTLDFWHLGRIFDSVPSLNADFIEADPRTNIFAVEGNIDNLYSHIFNRISAVRKMARYGNPSF